MPTGIYQHKPRSEETKKKISCSHKGMSKPWAGKYIHVGGYKKPNSTGEKHFGWKGDNVGYFGLHLWIKKHFGVANHCDKCGIKEMPKDKKYWFEWSQKTNKNSRNIKDWWQLCVPCHRDYDDWTTKITAKRIKSKCWIDNPVPHGTDGRFIKK